MKTTFIYMFVLTILAGQTGTLTAQEKVKAIDTANMDRSIAPGDDFFRFANGKWLDNNPIPDEYSSWGAATMIYENNQFQLQSIIEEASQSTQVEPGSVKQKIRDFYNSGMDSAQINKLGIKAIQPLLDQVDALQSNSDLAFVMGSLLPAGISPFFYFYTGADMKNASIVIANLYQGGLGLPERDYYLDDDDRSAEIRAKYSTHLENIFVLSGATPETAKQQAADVLEIETFLAKQSMSRVERRDPNKTYHKMRIKELKTLSPNFDWDSYFAALGWQNPDELNVRMPDFIASLSQLINETSTSAFRSYLRWNILDGYAKYLNEEIVAEHFDFYGTFLSGLVSMQPRWKRVLSTTSNSLGEGIGQLYVEKYFPPVAKERMVALVGNLKVALDNRINHLEWMNPETKIKAKEKLDRMNVKVGYPDKWIDYTALAVEPDNYVGNVIRASVFSFNREMAKLGKPVDKDEWGMTPQTVNAYYSPTMNEIVFPAGILQPPFFNVDADDPVNYGGIGVVIGHEMTHGFDDQGRKYDVDGNLNDWWQADDAEQFDARTAQLVKLYDSYTVIDTLTVNGKLTLGENIADLGGLNVAWDALQIALKEKSDGNIDGLSPEQRFFIGYAQIWRQNIRDKSLIRNLQEDVHSPGIARVNRPLFNLPQFYQAFEISEADKLYIPVAERADIW